MVTLLGGGDLLGEHEAAAAELATAMAQTRTSLADGAGVQELAERVERLEAQIAATRVTIILRGLTQNRFRALVGAHPADGEPFDRDTFPAALIAACVVDPPMTPQEALELGTILTDGQFDQLFSAAWAACRDTDDVPFSVLASAVTRT